MQLLNDTEPSIRPTGASAGAKAFGRLPNAVARDPRVSAPLLAILAYRVTVADDRSEYRLLEAHLKGIVRGGLGKNVIRREIALAKELGLLDRWQGPRGADGTWSKAADVLTLPEASRRTSRHVPRKWFDASLSASELGALLFLRAGTGKGRGTFTRELMERFGWSRPTAMNVVDVLMEHDHVRKIERRDDKGRFKSITYAPASFRVAEASTVKKRGNGSRGNGLEGDIRSRNLDELSSRDSPARPFSQERGYASDEAEAPPLASLAEEAFASEKLLGWSESDDLSQGMKEKLDLGNVSPDTFVSVWRRLSDEDLRAEVRKATGGRVAGEIMSLPGLFAIRFLAAVHAESGDITSAEALDAVLGALRERIGRRPGARLNSLALIGKRIAAQACAGGAAELYADHATAQRDPDPDLRQLLEADGARTLAPRLRRDASGLQAFLRKHGGVEALGVMLDVLRRHMLDGKPVHSITSWHFFEAAIADEKHRNNLAAEGVRPGDVFGFWRDVR